MEQLCKWKTQTSRSIFECWQTQRNRYSQIESLVSFIFWDVINVLNILTSEQVLPLTIDYVDVNASTEKCESQTCSLNLGRREYLAVTLIRTISMVCWRFLVYSSFSLLIIFHSLRAFPVLALDIVVHQSHPIFS